jgi:hypothetical protein
MRGGPPEAPSPRLAIRKRSVVKRACEGCRQRKAKVLFAIDFMKSKSDELKGRL